MSEPGSYEYDLAREASRPAQKAPATQNYTFTLPSSIAAKVDYEDLRQIMDLSAAMLATGTPLRILLRRMQAIRSYEQEG